jgi:hypothetical protein
MGLTRVNREKLSSSVLARRGWRDRKSLPIRTLPRTSRRVGVPFRVGCGNGWSGARSRD